MLDVYVKQQWRQATLSDSSAQLARFRLQAVYSYDNRLLHIQLTDQSPVSPVDTQPYQSSHQLIPIDCQTPFRSL